MKKEKEALRSTLIGAQDIIQALFGKPWEIEDDNIRKCYYHMNDMLLALIEEEKNDEADD